MAPSAWNRSCVLSVCLSLYLLNLFALAARPRLAEDSFKQGDCQPFPGKEVVLVTVNEHYENLFLNWISHASEFLTDAHQVVVWPEDDRIIDPLMSHAQSHANSLHPWLVVQPSSSLLQQESSFIEAGNTGKERCAFFVDPLDFGMPAYTKLVQGRPQHILYFLSKGCNVLYNDIDAVWLKSPFAQIEKAGMRDLYITDDKGMGSWESDYLCSCFLYMRSGNTTQDLCKRWAAALGGGMDQPALNAALRDMGMNNAEKSALLPRDQFPNGGEADKFQDPTVLHANYMVGLDAKVRWLKSKDAWTI
eukprot:TRINITY_DN8916_c0_g1_i1.p1 TRINITY_DN8916_c0_g1~~TRINITY_DN8916_c0_g1_i1.p1  ORF type:complete len:305 (+),score=40.15 TRINITY_DN8916_c0_g1_i1:69-983(+)